MKIKRELAEKLKAAKTVEEKAKILSDAGFELSEEEIERLPVEL